MDVNSKEAAEWSDLMRRNSALEHELRQCLTEIEEAGNLLRPQLPLMAGIYDAAAKRIAQTLAE
jgi:hypothetical protein